ncbi:protein FAM221B isoform X2 [Pleurodeles waltl]|uniref:protein FAM221B isoform X2 n=1 Tax=Pleurodeles waltl TaxID=8319 RepID=UPI003709472A
MDAPVPPEAQEALPPNQQEPQQPGQAPQTQEPQQPEPQPASQPQEPPKTQVSPDPPTDSEETDETQEDQTATEETAEETTEETTDDSKRSPVKSKTISTSAAPAKPAQRAKPRLGPNLPIKVREIFQAEAIAAAKAVKKGTSVKVPCAVQRCRCPAYSFIPSRPEEIGEMWLRKRKDFDISAWRAKCRCSHTHEEHRPLGGHACRAKDCRCQFFESNFLCAACDRKWEAHQTYFETTEMRRKSKLPFGEDYFPFAEIPELRNIVMSGNAAGGSGYKSLEDEIAATTTTSRALPFPSSGPWNATQR